MKKTNTFLGILIGFAMAGAASAAVTITFGSGGPSAGAFNDGPNGDDDGETYADMYNSTLSAVRTETDGIGFQNNTAEYQFYAGSAFNAELVDAIANGGTIEITATVLATDYTASDISGYYQLVLNSQADSLGGFGPNALPNSSSIYIPNLQADGQQSNVYSVDVADLVGSGNGWDGLTTSTGWANLHFGVNTDSGDMVTNNTVYISEITVTADVVPEPSVTLLGFLGVAGFLVRRRRI